MLFFYERIPIAGGDSDATEEVNRIHRNETASFRVLSQALHPAGEGTEMQIQVSAIDKMNGNMQAGAGALTHISIFLCKP